MALRTDSVARGIRRTQAVTRWLETSLRSDRWPAALTSRYSAVGMFPRMRHRTSQPSPVAPQVSDLAGCPAAHQAVRETMVPRKGLEPSRLAAQVPETCVSTNSTTWAWGG
ncbi:hypothetical protein OCAR_4449 [Afipia carboxidovorans OM5]|nr:hypothetical protein OCAR_4449 [Afipia carboxidovorans OM5]